MIETGHITELVHEYLDGTDKFLTELYIRPGNRIYIFIDGDNGITIEDCQQLTRFIESKVDRETEDYDITVSSSGADRPLKFRRQYAQHTGRQLDVLTAGGTHVIGKLIGVTENGIEIEPEAVKKEKKRENMHISFDEIREARVVLSFK